MLHPAERAELAEPAASERPAAVARCRTRKEAYLKGVGIGLGEDPTGPTWVRGRFPDRLPEGPSPTSRHRPVTPRPERSARADLAPSVK
ncbi:hypothetical protein ACGFXC_24440 [Streptomyces sp. NPDC048507]|uniref:hypothetical protein n=1 Tax=Streptomyces sp. NPDC048507 TaxID=3365560 RepID=UPI0037168EB1